MTFISFNRHTGKRVLIELFFILSLIVTTFGCIAFAQTETHLLERQPEKVVVGRSRVEVEALMGRSTEICWHYSEALRVCFKDNKASSYSELRDNGGLGKFALIMWGPEGGPVALSAVKPGDSQQRVVQLFGQPKSRTERYESFNMPYDAQFADEKLATWQNAIPWPIHP